MGVGRAWRRLRSTRPAPSRQRWVQRLGALALLCVATVMAAGPASAHDELLNATPRAGSTVDRLPGEVRLAFDDRVLPDVATVRVVAPSGRDVSGGSAAVDGTIVTQRMSGAAPAGTYRLAYRVVSADGHPIGGSWSFTVKRASSVDGSTGAATTRGSTGGSSSRLLEELALGVAVLGAAGSLVLRSRVIRRAERDEAGQRDETVQAAEVTA